MNPKYYTALRNYCTRYGIDWRFDTIQNPITLIWQVLKVVNELVGDMDELQKAMADLIQTLEGTIDVKVVETLQGWLEDGTLENIIKNNILNGVIYDNVQYVLSDYRYYGMNAVEDGNPHQAWVQGAIKTSATKFIQIYTNTNEINDEYGYGTLIEYDYQTKQKLREVKNIPNIYHGSSGVKIDDKLYIIPFNNTQREFTHIIVVDYASLTYDRSIEIGYHVNGIAVLGDEVLFNTDEKIIYKCNTVDLENTSISLEEHIRLELPESFKYNLMDVTGGTQDFTILRDGRIITSHWLPNSLNIYSKTGTHMVTLQLPIMDENGLKITEIESINETENDGELLITTGGNVVNLNGISTQHVRKSRMVGYIMNIDHNVVNPNYINDTYFNTSNTVVVDDRSVYYYEMGTSVYPFKDVNIALSLNKRDFDYSIISSHEDYVMIRNKDIRLSFDDIKDNVWGGVAIINSSVYTYNKFPTITTAGYILDGLHYVPDKSSVYIINSNVRLNDLTLTNDESYGLTECLYIDNSDVRFTGSYSQAGNSKVKVISSRISGSSISTMLFDSQDSLFSRLVQRDNAGYEMHSKRGQYVNTDIIVNTPINVLTTSNIQRYVSDIELKIGTTLNKAATITLHYGGIDLNTDFTGGFSTVVYTTEFFGVSGIVKVKRLSLGLEVTFTELNVVSLKGSTTPPAIKLLGIGVR